MSRTSSVSCQILDVTLRDGGYLNDWAFSEQEVLDVASFLSRNAVDLIEVGYVSERSSLPLTAHTPPLLLESIRNKCPSLRISVMLRITEDWHAALCRRLGLIDLIRIPCALQDLPQVVQTVDGIAQLGVSCSINLTSVSSYTQAQLHHACNDFLSRSSVQTVYLADSRGALRPDEIHTLTRVIKQSVTCSVGFHAHDNRGLALKNSSAALRAGAEFVDGSIHGFGLGGGNADVVDLLRLVGRKVEPNALPALTSIQPVRTEELTSLYRLAGRKNLEQEWVLPLQAAFGNQAKSILDELPRKRYQNIEEVFRFARNAH